MASSKTAIYTALGANLIIALCKFAAAGVTGSSAMLSEGIHSLVDTINEVMLLIGLKRSQKPPDKNRPFGYGREIYFWSYLVSLLIFAVGGGFSLYEGINHLLHPVSIENPHWNYIILGIAVILDGYSLLTAFRAFNTERGDKPFWSAVVDSKNPATLVVLFEDGSDVLGLIIAFLGVFLSHQFSNPQFDGIASILIGCLLMGVSILLARESRSLLMGEEADPLITEKIIRITEAEPVVLKAVKTLTFQVGPEDIVLVQEVSFRPNLTTDEIIRGISRVRQAIQAAEPQIRQVSIEPVDGNE